MERLILVYIFIACMALFGRYLLGSALTTDWVVACKTMLGIIILTVIKDNMNKSD